MNPFQSLSDYETYIYQLTSQFAVIQRSTLVLIRRGATVAVLSGELNFDRGIRLNIRERLTFSALRGQLVSMAMRSGRTINYCTGMIRSHIQAMLPWPVLILIISIFRQILNAIEFQQWG